MTTDIQPTATAEQEQAFQQASENSRQLATTLNAITLEQLQLSEQIGALKAFDFTKKLLTVSSIKMLAEIKETNKYKELKVISPDGELLTVSTWEDFCINIGKSRQHIDEEIRNLSAFGEDFLETSQRMGVGYRDLRKLRKIPEEEREVIINGEAVQAEDKDALVELIEDMSVKHAKDKAKLNSEIKNLKAEAKAKDRVANDKQTALDQKNDQIIELETKLAMKLDAPVHDRAKTFAVEIEKLKIDAISLLGKITALYEQIEQDTEAHHIIRINMGHALLEMKDGANAIIDRYALDDVSLVEHEEYSWVEEANAEIARRHQAEDESSLAGSPTTDTTQAFDLQDVHPN